MTRGTVTLHIFEVHNLHIQVLRRQMYVISVYYSILSTGEMIHGRKTSGGYNTSWIILSR